jgi:4-hydroxybenzoate polyprenyltransferase
MSNFKKMMDWFSRIRSYLELIRFSHTVFALPFALMAAFLALRNTARFTPTPETFGIIFWIVIAMIGARSGAMGFNRLVDRKWDKDNPRTSMRPSATGAIGPQQIVALVVLSFSILVYAAWRLNPVAFKLSPIAIIIVCFYSFTKRFTALSHLFLGLAIGIAPVAAWIAVTGTVNLSALIIGFSILTWIAGFDILYALQDLEFDRTAGLKSIPSYLGIKSSLRISRLLHVATVMGWSVLAWLEQLNGVFLTGIAIGAGLLWWEHRLLKANDLRRLDTAFFNMNAIISLTIMAALTLDIVLFV